MTAAAPRSGALLRLREGGIELTGPEFGQPDDLRRKLIHVIGMILLELGRIAAAYFFVGGITRDVENDPPIPLFLRLGVRFRLLRPLLLARRLAFDRLRSFTGARAACCCDTRRKIDSTKRKLSLT